MTTRRRRLPGPAPPRGRSGRFGLPPFAIQLLSVKRGIDSDGAPERAGKGVSLDGLAEAGLVAHPGSAAGGRPSRDEDPVLRRETDEVGLRLHGDAADTSSGRDYADSSSAATVSTGIPAGTSSSGATSALGDTGGSSPSTAGVWTGAAESGVSSTSTASGSGSPPTRSEPVPSSAWWAGTPQKREPGSAAFGQRLPFVRM